MRDIMRALSWNEVEKNTKDGFGFNAASGEYVDMFKEGIIDPLKVTRVALKTPVSAVVACF